MLNTPAIEIRNLVVIRGRNVVLPDFSVEVPTGTVTGLLGPSVHLPASRIP